MTTQIDCDKICMFTMTQMDIASKGSDSTKASPTVLDCLYDISDEFFGEVGSSPIPATALEPCCTDRILKIKYYPKDCEETTDDTELDCDWDVGCEHGESTNIPYEYINVELTKHVKASFTFEAQQCTCDDPSFVFQEGMRRMTQKLVKRYQDKLLKCVLAGAGNYHPDGLMAGANSLQSTNQLKLFTANGNINAMGMYNITDEMNLQCGEGAKYYVLGGNHYMRAWKYGRSVLGNGGCCGYDPTKISEAGANFCTDIAIQKCFKDLGIGGASPALSVAAGAFKILEYYKFEPANRNETFRADGSHVFLPRLRQNNHVKTKLDLAPYNNGRSFIVDAKMYLEPCGEKVTITVAKVFDVWKPPTNASNCNNTNGCLLWDVDCGDPSCADYCPPEAPVTEPVVEGEPKEE